MVDNVPDRTDVFLELPGERHRMVHRAFLYNTVDDGPKAFCFLSQRQVWYNAVVLIWCLKSLPRWARETFHVPKISL